MSDWFSGFGVIWPPRLGGRRRLLGRQSGHIKSMFRLSQAAGDDRMSYSRWSYDHLKIESPLAETVGDYLAVFFFQLDTDSFPAKIPSSDKGAT